MKLKIAVIGGSGFIGQYLCKYLVNKYDVTNFDIKKKKIKDVKFSHLNICNRKDVKKKLKGFDYVFHFGGLSDLNLSYNNALKTSKINIVGSINVLDACKYNKIKKIIFSSSIYSFVEEGGFYKAGKLAVEVFLDEYFKLFNLKYTIIRFGSIYGINSDLSNGITRLIFQSIKNKKVVYYGSKKTRRNYIDVQTAAKLAIQTISKKYDNKLVILKGNYSFSIKTLLLQIASILNIDKKNIFFSNKINIGHYEVSPKKLKIKKPIYFKSKKRPIKNDLLQIKNYIKNRYL